MVLVCPLTRVSFNFLQVSEIRVMCILLSMFFLYQKKCAVNFHAECLRETISNAHVIILILRNSRVPLYAELFKVLPRKWIQSEIYFSCQIVNCIRNFFVKYFYLEKHYSNIMKSILLNVLFQNDAKKSTFQRTKVYSHCACPIDMCVFG